jgi:biotin carboxyl carrier protein
LERAVLETEFYEKYYGTVETPVLRALNFKNYMEKRKLYIGEGELIVGEKSEGPQVAPTFPELCCHTLEDMTVMNDRKYISFKVKEEDKKVQEEKIIPYWEKRSMRHKILESMTQEWKDCYAAGMFTEFMEQRAPGHTVADGKIYEKGFLDFKEREAEPAEIKSNEPSSIIASKNAIVSKVIAKSGQPVVREGDVVYEGQTLIMGLVRKKNSDEFMMVPSDGIVYGKTYYNFEMKEAKVRSLSLATNKSKSVYYLKIKGNSIKIVGDKEPYENYNYREKVIKVPILSNITDISLLKGTWYEEVLKDIEIDKNTAENKMKISMYDELLKRCDDDSSILKSTINFSEDEEFYYLTAQIEVIEDIGERVRIYPLTEETEEKMEE